MFGIGIVEFVIVGMVLLAGLGGLIAVVSLAVRATRQPRNCPHCGKPLG